MSLRVSLLVLVALCCVQAAPAAPAPLMRRTTSVDTDFTFDAGTPERARRVAVLIESDLYVQHLANDEVLRQRFGTDAEARRLGAKLTVSVEGSILRLRPAGQRDAAVMAAAADRLTGKVNVAGWSKEQAERLRETLGARLGGQGQDKRLEAYLGAAEVIVEPLTPLGASSRR